MWKIQVGRDHQFTLVKRVKIRGLELYKKGTCSMDLEPAGENRGITFMAGDVVIPARHEFMQTGIDGYTTVLKRDGIELRTVEHILSALWGCGLDNVLIRLSSDQIPMIDGSAEAYCQAIRKVGMRKLKGLRKYLVFNRRERFVLKNEPDRYVVFEPADGFSFSATSVFNNLIGTQSFSHKWSPASYWRDIAWARSFLNSPVETHGGAVWENVRKMLPLLPENPRKSPVITYTQKEYLTPLKVNNEPVRHKMLDFYGDISLLGLRMKAEVTVYKPGHNFTREIVASLAAGL